MTGAIESRIFAPTRRSRAARVALRNAAWIGLASMPKTLPSQLLYDDAGAALFEQICELEEYYPTRTELAILRARATEIAALAGPGAALIEYGSGAGVKVRLLLDALDSPAAYVPIDISREQLARVAAAIQRDYPAVRVAPVAADYSSRLRLPRLPRDARRVAFFPGSSIGNFHPTEAAAFLRRVRRTVGPGGALVLGIDRRKDGRTLRAAYDDRKGVTAAFNLNVLARLNRELGADFDLTRFRHRALWNAHASRVEMHLVSTARQVARVAGVEVAFAAGETIWTESSYKYAWSQFNELVSAGGFGLERLWTDEGGKFWVAVLTV